MWGEPPLTTPSSGIWVISSASYFGSVSFTSLSIFSIRSLSLTRILAFAPFSFPPVFGSTRALSSPLYTCLLSSSSKVVVCSSHFSNRRDGDDSGADQARCHPACRCDYGCRDRQWLCHLAGAFDSKRTSKRVV